MAMKTLTVDVDVSDIDKAMATVAAKLKEMVAAYQAEATSVLELTGGRPKLAWGQKVSSTFRDRVWWIADEITKVQKAFFDANWLMACIAWESGESFSASKKNLAGSG